MASFSAARLTAADRATASSSSVWRSSSPSRRSGSQLITLSAATGSSPANSGTQISEWSPVRACSLRLIRGSVSVSEMSSVSRASTACLTIESASGRRWWTDQAAVPPAAATTTSSPSNRLTIAPSDPVSVIAQSTIRFSTLSRSLPAAAMSR